MRHLLFGFLVVVALVAGGHYAAGMLYRLMGPWSAVGTEQDGSQTYMQFDPDLPRPEWLPVPPEASVVQASKVTSVQAPSGFHSLELSTPASLDEVKRFYTERLTAAGFDVSDLGTYPVDAATAKLLGLDGTLVARRPSTDDQVDIQIRTPEGLLARRLLQIHWRKISEFPAASMPPPQGKS